MNRGQEAEKGLTSKEAARLLIQYGENRLEGKRKISPLKIFAGQFKDMMVLILLAATAISAVLGEASEALTIVVIVLANALLGFFQEYRTEKTLESLKKLSAPHAKVMRDGEEITIPATGVVPGDLMILSTGDRVAADGAIVSESALACDEAILTGESEACEKRAATGSEGDKQSAKEAMAFMGATVVKGRGTVRVSATGMSTEMGSIAGMLAEIEEEETPLQKRLDQIGKSIGVGCLAICAVVALTGILRGEDPLNMLITGISLAVAAVPEGLPAIVTISLALAVRRILRRNALIKKLHAVETLGCATVICSDKTGTLTEGRMTVKRVVTLSKDFSMEGENGESAARTARESPSVRRLAEAACFCNNATVSCQKQGMLGQQKKAALGEPTEAALQLMADSFGLSPSSFHRTDELPFDSKRKRMSVTGESPDGRTRVYVKGAPDLLLPLCSSVLTDGGIKPVSADSRRKITEEGERMAGEALRVIGFAYKECAGARENPETKLTFIGLAGLYDPPRKEAFAAVSACRTAHIRPVMITGDHQATAKAIAEKLGIYRQGDRLLTGAELDAMSDEALDALCQKASVYARVTPAHKLRIVRAIKRQGEIVAMTGDGVNDAPALKEANIGVAMGQSGTDVTKEAASVILLDDNFATLVAAIEEGRVIYKNIRRFLRYLLSCNIGEVFTMFVGMLMGMPVILTPIQLLLVNLATDGLPAIALGLEKAERDVMKERPRPAGESVFAGGLLTTMLFRGMLIGVTTLGVFSVFISAYGDLALARTAALVTLVTTQLFHVFECKSETKGILEINPFTNPLLIGAVLASALIMAAAVYLPAAAGIFGTVALTLGQLGLVLVLSVCVPILSSIFFMVSRHARRKRSEKVIKNPRLLRAGK